MGFNKRYLPEIEILEEIRKNFSNDLDFIQFIWGKSDVLLGSVESYRYLENVQNSIKNKDSVNV